MATTITARLAAWLQQEAGGLGLREVRPDGRDPAAHPAVVLRMLSAGGTEPVSRQELELRIVAAGSRPDDLREQLARLTAALRSRLARFCLEQPELRSIRWLETSYPRPEGLAGGPVLASSVSRIGLTVVSANAQEVHG